jgi:tetratricopeptide (TPR) repeat protein
MNILDNIDGGTNYVEFNFNGNKGKINIKAHYHFTQALELYKANNIAEASKEINKCIQANPENQNTNYYKGFIVEDIPDYLSAIEAYKKSLQIDSSQFWVWFRLGICQQSLKEYEEAIYSFTNSLNGFENFSDPLLGFILKIEQIYSNRAISYGSVGKSQLCIEDCSKAIDINPEYPNSYFVRGLEYLKLNKWEMRSLIYERQHLSNIRKQM